ncbi:MAG: DMT family transporter, partial [Planctomycetota bacterium]
MPSWFGPDCGLMSAILYTIANIALRKCVGLDAYLVSSVKAAPTVLCLAPILVWRFSTPSQHEKQASQTSSPSQRPHPLWQFLLASFFAQFFGNAAFQKALGYIGLAASVPITLGTLIVGGAVLGAILLGEPVGRRKLVAMMTLIIAVIILSLPRSESALPDEPVSATGILVGSLWAAVSGLSYSFFGVTMRKTLHRGYRASELMFISGLTGTVTLWAYTFAVTGWTTVAATSADQWLMMSAAGLFNFLAFIAITSALRHLPVVAVNLINASQVAMAAAAGVMLFGEPVTWALTIGIGLTFVGLLILARRTRAVVAIT